MILKRHRESPLAPLRPLLRRRRLIAFAAVGGLALLLGSTALAGIYYGMYLHKVKVANSLADFVDDVLATRLRIIPNFLRAQLGPRPERLDLHISHQNFQKLAFEREQALQRGILIASPEGEVPARLDSREGTARVKVRLKGDWVDQLTGHKWAFRVKTRGDDTLMGMEVFSLHHPRARRFIYEWIFHQALRREGLLHLRYEFVDLWLNGRDLGIYALEEHFDKRLLERSERREGPILNFSEDLHWRDIDATGRVGRTSATGVRGFRAGYVDAFRKKALEESPLLWEQFQAGASLLEGFRLGELSTSQVFDTRQLASYFALLDLLGGEHAAAWINFRFYYNPFTARLEPIGFDANAGAPLRHPLGSSQGIAEADVGVTRLAFRDPLFVAEYAAALERVSEPAYLDGLLAEIGPDLERSLSVLHREFPYVHFDAGILRANQKTIREVLAPVKGIHAYYDGAAEDVVRLELANLGALPLEVLQLQNGDAVPLVPEQRTVLWPSAFSEPAAYQGVAFPVPGGSSWAAVAPAELRVAYRVVGTQQQRAEAVFPWPRRIAGFAAVDLMRQPPNAAEFEFVEIDAPARILRIAPGRWTLDRDLILPAGFRVQAGPDTQLDLVDSALIVSSSPLELQGTPDSPVVIESSDGTGQGLVVVGASAESRLDYVIFRGLRNPDRKAWRMTGAVTFYESPVSIAHSAFLENQSEDGLNLVRSSFRLETSLFRDTTSDAFDADFSDGVVQDCRFVDLQNDGVDVSGSTVTVSRVRVEGAGDKGVSAGERSTVTIHDLEVTGSNLGVASKDRSSVSVDGLRVENSKIGLAVFVKKPEFGPASMEVRGAHLETVDTRYLLETGSQLTIDGKSIEPNQAAVKALLYESG